MFNQWHALCKNGGEVLPAMNKQINLFNLKIFVAALICFFAFSNAFAASAENDKIARSLVVGNLSARLQKTVSNISYDFVEASVSTLPVAPADYAPTSNEEFLMRELMKQVSKDYNTDNIVLALDTVENSRISLDERVFTGVGEVRIGDFRWNKIKFDVAVDADGKATKVVYDLKK